MAAPSGGRVRGFDEGEAPLDEEGERRRERDRQDEPRRPGAPAGGAVDAVLALDGFLQQGRKAVDGLAPCRGAPDPFREVRRRARHGGDAPGHGVDAGGHASLHVVEFGPEPAEQRLDIGRGRRGRRLRARLRLRRGRRLCGFRGLRLAGGLFPRPAPEFLLDPAVLVLFRHGPVSPCLPVAPARAMGYAGSG